MKEHTHDPAKVAAMQARLEGALAATTKQLCGLCRKPHGEAEPSLHYDCVRAMHDQFCDCQDETA